MAQSDKFKNKCQYWATSEPPQCVYWDDEAIVCTYGKDEEGNIDPLAQGVAERAPYCNLIGTAILCNKYKKASDAKAQQRCILPDSKRHVCNRTTGLKWVVSVSGTWDFDAINGYNDGTCDGFGTDVTCSGYSPYHMGFGTLIPSDDPKYDTFKDSYGNYIDQYSTTKEFGYRLPTNFVVYNLRAALSKCYWWRDDPGTFTVDQLTGEVSLSSTWMCNSPSDTSKHSLFTLENGPPCNGCKPECLFYTGVCWQYCIDEKMESGDPILAEQIHELRYYHRENGWTTEAIELLFLDNGDIFAWSGTKDNGMACELDSTGDKIDEECVDKKFATLKGNLSVTLGVEGKVQDYEIPAVHTKMSSFDTFIVDHKDVVLTKGTKITGALEDYPTLIRELNILSLDPIIKNKLLSLEKDQYIFESALLADSDILVYGKVFYTAPTYAINLSDKDLVGIIPSEIYSFDNLLTIELTLGTKAFDEFYINYEKVINTLFTVAPHKIYANELSTTDNTSFIIKVPTFYADKTSSGTTENIIMVFQITKYGLLYSKLKFNKEFVGGVLLQNTFRLEGDNKAVKTPYNYTKDFLVYLNKNGSMSFSFQPLTTNNSFKSSDNYMYNDLTLPMLEGDGTVFLGHKLYKITKETYVLQDGANNGPIEFRSLGSDGYILIDIDHSTLNSVFGPWEVEEIMITYLGSEPAFCEMEIVHHGANGLLRPQQLIVKPKDISKFRSMCMPWITLKKLTYLEKRSFEQDPFVPEGWSSELYEPVGSKLSYNKDNAKLEMDDNTYTLSEFVFTMVPSVVINNLEGKPFTQYRTKAIGWCKQPYCPDVEINYSWAANATLWDNNPSCFCCGPWTQVNPRPYLMGRTPPCGDHDLPFSNGGQGPMWWPYVSCESFETYGLVYNLDNFSFDVIGLFKDEDPLNKEHGDHDMRMLGPSTYDGFPGYGCNFLVMCTCNWRTYNIVKTGDNYFTGWARIRGLVSIEDSAMWKAKGEQPPKFGNINRAQLQSFRTLDRWQYLRANSDGSWSTDWTLMPAAMMFNHSDFTSTEKPMWNFGASNVGPNVINPLGMFISNDLDGIPIDEQIDYTHRFKFDDVFNCRSVVDQISYPAISSTYLKSRKAGPINPWYEFKRYPVGGSSEYIQWAWQESWKPIERNPGDFRDFFIEYLKKEEASFIKGPFIIKDYVVKGIFLFLNVDYPEYKYDYKNKEFHTSLSEGTHFINFVAPVKDEYTGEYLDFIGLSLDDGPLRGVDWGGTWLTPETPNIDKFKTKYNIDLYDKCIGGPEEFETSTITYTWLEDVTLFDVKSDVAQSITEAEADDRMIKTFYVDVDDKEFTRKSYFKRGLSVSTATSMFIGANLPMKLLPVFQFTSYGDTSETTLVESVCGLTEYVNIGYGFDEIKRTIAKINVSICFGPQLITDNIDPTKRTYSYYHIPQVIVYASDNGVTEYTEIFRTDGMELYEGDSTDYEVLSKIYTWSNTINYISDGKKGLLIKFRVTPTEDELSKLSDSAKESYSKSLNFVKVLNIQLYEEILVDAEEQLTVWERLYYVSHGTYGDLPLQGLDPDVHVLNPNITEKSTVYQQNDTFGIKSISDTGGNVKTASKVSSRHLYSVHKDGEPVKGDVATLESKQKDLFDEAISINPTDVHMKSIKPPGLNNAVNFPINNYLFLHNSVVSPLAEINNFPPMNGEGNRYEPFDVHHSRCERLSPCGYFSESAFEYKFTNKDDGGGSYTGSNFTSALNTLYTSTATMLDRITTFTSLVEGSFSKKYGSSTSNKIWKDSTVSDFYYYPLVSSDSSPDVSAIESPDWNTQLFNSVGLHWNNAYFGYVK